VLAGPRGLGGLIIDLFDSRARAKRREAKANIARSKARPAGGGSGTSGAKPAAPAKPKSSQLGAKAPASAGSEKK
jgi:hypothetical protein